MFEHVRELAHVIKRGRARTSNPYRNGSVIHPQQICSPESGRAASDYNNQHTTTPKQKGRRV